MGGLACLVPLSTVKVVGRECIRQGKGSEESKVV